MFVALRGPSEKGATVWLDTRELQAKALRIPTDSRRNPSIGYSISHDCRSSHSFRRGQPAVTQARSSSVRHNVERPIRTGWGILPAASHVRHVRSDLPHIGPACFAVTRKCCDTGRSLWVVDSGIRICLVSIRSHSLLTAVMWSARGRRCDMLLPKTRLWKCSGARAWFLLRHAAGFSARARTTSRVGIGRRYWIHVCLGNGSS